MASEQRQHERFQITRPVKVVDTFSSDVLGLIVNVSADGFMLIGEKNVVDDAVYQIQIKLSDDVKDTLYLGVECLWVSEADTQDKKWSGYKIIDISEDGKQLLHSMIEQL